MKVLLLLFLCPLLVLGQTIQMNQGAQTSGPGTGAGGGSDMGATIPVVADAVQDSTCSMDGSNADLTCTDSPFTTCPIGKVMSVNQALAKGSNAFPLQLVTTVLSCRSPSVAVLELPSTNATGPNVTAIWGTDNSAVINSTAAANAGKSIIFPRGSYLYHVTASQHITATSNTSYWILPGATIYFVGVPGVFNADEDKVLFLVPDDSVNITIRIDGTITGENTGPYDGNTTMNQSAIVYGFGAYNHPAKYIDISGTGTLSNLYGFDIHNAGHGYAWNVRNLTHIKVAKGMNVNSNYSQQTGNIFTDSGGIENSGAHSNYSFNTFNNSGLQYVMSLGGAGGTVCPGNVVQGNIINGVAGTLAGAISVGDCFSNGLVQGNMIYGLYYNGGIGVTEVVPNTVRNNIIANNTIDCTGGLAAIYSATASSNKFIGNVVTSTSGTRCNYGALFNGSNAESFNNTYVGASQDIQFNDQTNTLSVMDNLNGTGTYLVYSGTLDPRSVFLPLGTSPGGGPVNLSSLTGATQDNNFNNGNYKQRWMWSLSSAGAGLWLSENQPSTAAGAVLLQSTTLAGSTAWPLWATANGSGVGVDDQGIVEAIHNGGLGGTGTFWGNVRLSASLAHLSSLGTDEQGNIIAGGGGPTALNNLTGATANNFISNGNYSQQWNFALTSAAGGLILSESAASTNPNAALLRISATTTSLASPLLAVVGTNGLTVEAQTGNIRARGTAKLVGPVQLPASMASKPSLATDVDGNIIEGTGGAGPGPGPGGGPTFPAFNPPQGTSNITADDFEKCRTFFIGGGSTTLVLPATMPPNGQCIYVFNFASSSYTVQRGVSTQLINGANQATLGGITVFGGTANTPAAVKIISDGNNWLFARIVGGFNNLGGGTSSNAYVVGVNGSLTTTSNGIISANQLLGSAIPALATGYLYYTAGTGFSFTDTAPASAGIRASAATHPAGSIACFKDNGELGSCQSAMSGTPPRCTCQ